MRSGLRRAVPADGRIFDLREADVDHRAAGALNVIDHFRQAVQGLRAEYHVDAGRAAADQFAFLRGHATADADDHRRILFFQQAPAPQHGENFLLRFSRIEQVFSSSTSASSAFSVHSKPCVLFNRSAIFDESYSFIWQPGFDM